MWIIVYSKVITVGQRREYTGTDGRLALRSSRPAAGRLSTSYIIMVNVYNCSNGVTP